MSIKAVVERTLREANKEADSLANGDVRDLVFTSRGTRQANGARLTICSELESSGCSRRGARGRAPSLAVERAWVDGFFKGDSVRPEGHQCGEAQWMFPRLKGQEDREGRTRKLMDRSSAERRDGLFRWG